MSIRLLLVAALAFSVASCPFAAAQYSSDNAPYVTKTERDRTELDLPVDESIKVSIEPLAVSNLVDRVLAPCTVTVKSNDSFGVKLYYVSVDAPYGGFATNKPMLLAQDSRAARTYTFQWKKQLPYRYIKFFAVVQKRNALSFRSQTLDLAMGGSMYDPEKSPD